MLAYMCYTVVEKLVRERAEWGCGKFSGTFSFSPGALRLPRIERCCMAEGLIKVDVEWIMGHFGQLEEAHIGHVDMLRVARHVHESLDWFKFNGTCSQKSLIWLVVWKIFYDFPYIGNVIIPTDEHIFQRGIYHQLVLFYGCTCSRCWCCCWALIFLRLSSGWRRGA